MKEKVLNAYQPPEHFEEVGQLPPVVQEAADDNTELWLIRFPANEIGPADLLEKQVNLKVGVQDGIVGHFLNSRGEDYNIVKQGRVRSLQPYAFIPNGTDPLVVRKVACQVAFVKSLTVEDPNAEKTPHRSGEHHDQTTSGLTSEREEGALQDDVEKPLKKKRRRRSEASEQT